MVAGKIDEKLRIPMLENFEFQQLYKGSINPKDTILPSNFQAY